MPNNAVQSWNMFIPLFAVLFLGVAWSAYWFIAANIAKSQFEAEREKLKATSTTLACTEEDWGGFPFHFEFSCESPVVTYESVLEIKSEKLLLTALAYAPWQVVALLDGPTTLAGERLLPTKVTHQRAIAAITLGRDGNSKLSAELPDLMIPEQGRIGKLMIHTRPSAKGGTDIALSVTDVNYRPMGKPPLAVAQGDIITTLLPNDSLEVETFMLEQGQVRYWGKGTVKLDSEHRPEGKLDTETNDLTGLLNLLEPHLPISNEQKSYLRTMLGLLGKESKAPLIAKDGALYLGPFKITDLQPIR